MKCCDMTAGKLRTVVSFERATRVADGAGGFAETWAPIANAPTRAHVQSLSGGERWASERIEATVKARVTCRYFAGLTEADRVVIDGKAHNVRFIDNVEMAGKWLRIEVAGGVAT